MKFLIPLLPLLFGFLLDALFGDPYRLPHPIRLIGTLIAKLEVWVRMHFKNLRAGGGLLCLTVLLLSAGVPLVLLVVCYHVHMVLGVAVESVLCYYLLAARCLRDESMKVCCAMEQQDTEGARYAVSMIVGRDTKPLDGEGILRAAVETVAENTSDGVTAPLFYMAFGGAVLGFFYKAANTMDSMLGYRNEKYGELGFIPAKLDDVLNYIPSRLTALLMCLAAFLCGLDGRAAFRIWKRDHRKHASPNSAQTEAACAGALHVRLAGDAWYGGILHKKDYIGNNDCPVTPDTIRRANRLMYVTAVLMLVLCCVVRGVLF
ncbi:MAG: adenosylcobinamide-phosphate synthase CbiB [Oscillospiraceae bacterium]|nr:adenosylcobinamide-phosphate synthase CbiB [Oscillospiraceae bacterium]